MTAPVILHPATAALLALPCWTDHPAVPILLDAMRYADEQALRLDAAGEHEAARCFGRIEVSWVERSERWTRNDPETCVAPTGGVCSDMWERLTSQRDDWIVARLRAEGLRPDLVIPTEDGEAYLDRYEALHSEAPTVASLWGSDAVHADVSRLMAVAGRARA